MSNKLAFRVIQDSKHTGTVTRQQVDEVVRKVSERHDVVREAEGHFKTARANGSTKR